VLCIPATEFFSTCHISETARDRHILLLERKTQNYVFYQMASLLMTLDDRHTNVPIFLLRDAMLAWYRPILCYGPVFVRPSVWLVAVGPCNAKSCRRTRVAMSSSPWPIATDAQLWRGRSIHAAYCYSGFG